MFFSLIACKEQNRGKEQELLNLLGKKFIFPSDAYYYNCFSECFENVDFNSSFKIVSYIDSYGCVACKLKMYLWEDLLKEIEVASNKKVLLLFIIDSNSKNDVKFILRDSQFNYPVCFDDNGLFDKFNDFPDNYELQTYLLNESNDILIVGNPILNKSIKNLYLNMISKGR